MNTNCGCKVKTVSASGCGCCEGTEILTPLPTSNRPGLSALKYRIGTQSSFLETMKARLTSADHPALKNLTTREESDASLALLDASSTMLDVLTFYQERITNEGYLRTATERRSILELARLVGYKLKPGVAASVYLAYLLDDSFKEETIIPIGSAAQSVPGPGEAPQTFETSEKLKARAGWSKIKPKMSRPQTKATILDEDAKQGRMRQVYLKGISTNLKPNDPMLIDFGDGKPQFFRVQETTTDPIADRTQVVFQPEASFNRQALELKLNQVQAELGQLGKAGEKALASFVKLKDNLVTSETTADLLASIETDFLPKLIGMTPPTTGAPAKALAGVLEKSRIEISQVVSLLKAEVITAGVDTLQFDESKVIEGLSKKASLQPATQQRLDLALNRNFVSGAESNLQLPGVFDTKLRNNLPIATANAKLTEPSRIKVYALRARASLFGHNHPGKLRYTKDPDHQNVTSVAYDPLTFREAWQITGVEEKSGLQRLVLDTVYDPIVPESWIVVEKNGNENVFPVATTQVQSMTAFAVSHKVSQLTLRLPWLSAKQLEEEAKSGKLLSLINVYAQSELLPLADEPISTEVCTGELELDALYDGLEAGRWVIVSGERVIDGTSGVFASELAMISAVRHDVQIIPRNEIPNSDVPTTPSSKDIERLPGDRNHTFITLAFPLAYCFKRDTVTIYANVVKATHGATKREALGSGDASKALQSFMLKAPPLTFMAAPTASGADSSLKVLVNDVEWHEADALVALQPSDRQFITQTDDNDKTAIIFGNGKQGARLPTGRENLTASYRSGIGKAGNVKAEQISLLQTRPLGVKEVINPLPATGGANREGRDQARKNAPLGVTALDRLVAVQDYADFAHTFAGIGKAYAAKISDRHRELIHVTIAGADDIPIDNHSDLFRNLARALHDLGDPYQPLKLEVRELMLLILQAGVRIQRDYQWEKVEPQIRAALLDALSFERRELGQDAMLGEIISVMQGVRGVEYVDVDVFGGVPEKEGLTLTTPTRIAEIIKALAEKAKTEKPNPHVSVNLPVNGNPKPAQIAYFTPDVKGTLILNLMDS